MARRNNNRRTTLFGGMPKSMTLADVISITSPNAFHKSINILRDSGGSLSLTERRALVFAQNRARAQLGRRNLSDKERKQFRRISRIRVPPTGSRPRRR